MYRIPKRVVVRACAVLGWLCAVPASPAQVITPWRYLDESGVYNLWRDYIDASGDADLEAAFADCHTAADMWQVYYSGFEVRPLYLGNVTVRGSVILTNGLAYVSGYPVVSTTPPNTWGIVTFPKPFDVEIPELPPLTYSVWEILRQLATNATYNLNTHVVVLQSLPINSLQPHGRLKQTAYRMVWENAPMGQVGALVRYAPVWWAGTTDYCVTPQTYRAITGEWPSWILESRLAILLTREMRQLLQTNATFRIKERWE